jgi:pyruvate dehydrogenase phosphatase
MRRIALQVLRPARRPLARREFRHRTSAFISSNHALGIRTFVSRRGDKFAAVTLASSMQLRSFSAALVAAAVAGGAWYYKIQTPLRADSSANESYSRGLSTSSTYSNSPLATASVKVAREEPVPTTRNALVVDQGQLYSVAIEGNGPVSTDVQGRKILEMLTPDQATQKLRKNEQSWSVGRGRGVVRYDVVQIPSNDPIEDDHVEKIIEVPQSVAAAGEEGATSSDWMFWGVFDGHR